ncbi:MAG: ABC transporter ATP-binding protein [Ancrocorticia sp.]
MTAASGLALADLATRVGSFDLSAICLQVAPGEILAVVGPSGCGKTTLLHAIAGMRRCSGSVTIDDDVVTHVPPERRATALVLQAPVLFPGMTVRENVGYGLDDARMPREKRGDLIDIAMASMNISGLAHRDPQSLSGGQAQRVALARTLVRRPRVLLLDEPLSHVEPPMRRAIRKDIVEQVRRRKLAAVYVTHDVEEAFLVGDRLAVMRKGRIEQQDEPIQIYRQPQSRYVADLLGRVNIVAGSVKERARGGIATVTMGRIVEAVPAPRDTRLGPVAVVLPPESIVLEQAPSGSEIIGDIGQVIESSFAGSWAVVDIESELGTLVVHEWDPDRPRPVGEYVRFSLRPGRGWVLPQR